MRERGEQELANVRLLAQAKVRQLNPFEETLLSLLAEGYSGAQMASAMNIPKTEIELIRRSMMTKVGANCSADAVRIALQAGLNR